MFNRSTCLCIIIPTVLQAAVRPTHLSVHGLALPSGTLQVPAGTPGAGRGMRLAACGSAVCTQCAVLVCWKLAVELDTAQHPLQREHCGHAEQVAVCLPAVAALHVKSLASAVTGGQ